MKPIIGYARVSTEEQADTQALEQQKNRLFQAGATRIYVDIESGQNPEREQLIWLSRAKIARELFDYFLKVRKPTKLLRYLQDNYGLQKNQDLLVPALKDFPTSSRGIKQWLQNPVFQGHTAYQKYKANGGVKTPDEWDIRRDTHPDHRLITEEEAQEIQAILTANSKQFGQLDATFYLTGHIFCQTCKSRCGLKRGGGYAYYGCQHSATVCSNRKVVRIVKIEQAIISKLVQRAGEIHQLPKSSMKSSKLIDLEIQYEFLDKIPGSDFTPALKEAKEKLLKEIEKERSQTNDIATQMLSHPTSQKINFWYSLTQEEREIFYNQLLERVVILDGKVTEVLLKV